MSTNINAIKTTKSARVSIKAESYKMDKPFNFTGKGEITFSADGNLTFAGTGKFTKAEHSTMGPTNNDIAVLNPSKSSTHLGLPPVPILKKTEDQTDMVPPGFQSHKTISGGNQLMHNGNNSSVPGSMVPTNSEMSSQASGPGIHSSNGATDKTVSHIAKPFGPEDYTPENLATLREKNRQELALVNQRLAAHGEIGKIGKSPDGIKVDEAVLKMAEEINLTWAFIENNFSKETRASVAKYKKRENLFYRRGDIVITTACEVHSAQAGRDRLDEILLHDVNLTYEEAMTVQYSKKT
ncbi:hypothetical protein KCU65_g8875, partial [Aureobasidium melanogenum]